MIDTGVYSPEDRDGFGIKRQNGVGEGKNG
jgi:hypothetical protein